MTGLVLLHRVDFGRSPELAIRLPLSSQHGLQNTFIKALVSDQIQAPTNSEDFGFVGIVLDVAVAGVGRCLRGFSH